MTWTRRRGAGHGRDCCAWTPEAHAHDYFEELYILEGDLIIIDGPDDERRFEAPSCARRAPGAMHGPVRTETGCLMLEFARYDDADTGGT